MIGLVIMALMTYVGDRLDWAIVIDQELGVGLLRAPVAGWASGYVRHDPDALAKELLRLYHEKSHTRVYG